MNKRITIISVVIILIIWLSCFFIPLCFAPEYLKKDIIDYYGISFLSISALFTGVAFVVAYLSLYHQNQNLHKQIDLNIFTATMHEVMDSERYRECRKYIYSESFHRDIRDIKRFTNKDIVVLTDIRKIYNRNDIINDKDIQNRLNDSYEKIIFFCNKMEYLGLIHKRYAASSFILDYYGRTIIETYRIIRPLLGEFIGKTGMYYHFNYLYRKAEEAEKKYLMNIEN